MNTALRESASILEKVRRLDISLFDPIHSETTADDRRSMLAIQAAVAARLASYTYLEIGSHLGGSIQPYLLDDRCTRIISIDKRPMRQPDERGNSYGYTENSTEKMLENLKGIAAEKIGKIATIDADSSEISASALPSRADLCFIDGEHTNAAAERDYSFCGSALADKGVIYFHDSAIVFQAIDRIVRELKAAGRAFHAYNLPSAIFVIDFGLDIHEDETIRAFLLDNYVGYLAGLQSMAHYRRFYNFETSRLLRRLFRSYRVKGTRA
jgi:hypothetical protein